MEEKVKLNAEVEKNEKEVCCCKAKNEEKKAYCVPERYYDALFLLLLAIFLQILQKMYFISKGA